jgi:hypothetical protein
MPPPMTVSSEVCGPISLRWTGAETSFPAGFAAGSRDAIEAFYLADADGSASIPLTLDAHFGVTLADGSNLVTVTPLAMPAAPGTLILQRQTAALQETDFGNLAAFSPAIHTALHDASAMRDAEMRRDLAAAGVIMLTVTGGTGSAIQATAGFDTLVPGARLYALMPSAANVGATTLSVDGGRPLPIHSALGASLADNALTPGAISVMLRMPTELRLLLSTPVDASGVLADVLAARDTTTAARDQAVAAATDVFSQAHTYDTLAVAIAATIPVTVNSVRTTGRSAIGIGGATWTRLGGAPGTPRSWHFHNTVDGSWWIMQAGWMLTAAMFEAGSFTNTAIQDALDYLKTFGLTGGRVTCEPNQTYTGTAAPVVWNGLTLDANGSKIQSTLSGANVYGLRVGDNSEFCNGWAHTVDAGITSLQAIFGAGISLGECNGLAGNLVGAPSYFGATTRPRLRNVKASTTRLGGQAVQAMGDVDFDIDGLEFPDSTTMCGFSADWSDVGGVTVAAGSGVGGAYISDLERLTNWRNAFNAGTVVTTHPRGNIRRVRAGALTSATQNGLIRLSACYGVTVFDVHVKEISGPVVNGVGGDFGFEFASTTVKAKAYRGIRWSNIRADKCDNWAAFVETGGDNLRNAIALGYASLTPGVMRADIVIDALTAIGSGAADVVRVQFAQGVQILNSKLSGGLQGVGIEDQVDGVVVSGCEIFANAFSGVNTKAVATIKDIAIKGNVIYGNGTGSSGTNTAGVHLQGGSGLEVDRNIIGGDSAEATQQYAVAVDAAVAPRAATVTNNLVRNVKVGGVCFLNGNSGSDVLWLIRGNQYAGAELVFGGQAVLPVERTPRIAGVSPGTAFHTRYICAAASVSAGITPPAGPTYVQGDLCEIPDAASGTPAMVRRGASTWSVSFNANS